jgi:hypothetical protein
MKSVSSIPPQNLGNFFSKNIDLPQETSNNVFEGEALINGAKYSVRYEQDDKSRTPLRLSLLTKERILLGDFKVETDARGDKKTVFIPGNCHGSKHLENVAVVINMLSGTVA